MSDEKRCFLIKTILHRDIPEHSILATDERVIYITSYDSSLEDFLMNFSIPYPVPQKTPLLEQTVRELQEYFAGKRSEFFISYQLSGTLFQQKVYQTLHDNVKYGHTISYGELAVLSGYPGASRAVGSAMKNNPLPFIIPCHRVIKADGKPGEYGGGTHMKLMLINMEKSSEF